MKDLEPEILHVGHFILQQGELGFADDDMSRILGYENPDQLIGKSILEMIHPQDHHLVNFETTDKETPQTVDRFIVRFFKQDGTVLDTHVGGVAAIFQDAPAYVGHLVDITGLNRITRYFTNYLMSSQSIIDQIEDGVSEVDLKGNATFASKANRKIWGNDEDGVEAIGINYRSFMDEETAQYVKQAYEQVYKTGIPGKNIVYEIIRKDGVRRTIESSVTLIRNEEGEINGFRSVNRDITERQKAEQELAEHRVRLEAIFRSVKDAIITVDTQMRGILANQAMYNICGISPADISGKSLSEALGKCSKACCEVIRQTLEKKTTIKDYRIECGHAQRNNQLVSLTSSRLMDPEGRFTGAMLVIRDITLLRDLERELRERHKFQNMIGKSRKMQDIYRLLEDLANLETTVLITGESGTGKELVAKAIHYGGQRAFHPFVTVNCSALTESLLESELFGHVKGAFTGAIYDKQGRFQAANGGTILLDEIGDISPLIQLKLLRVLQEKVIERVGESQSHKVDVRIVACTNKDLKEKVQRGEFREDLYYRLKVVEVSMPPLRDRLDDLPLLINHFRDFFNERFKKDIEGLSNEVLKTFMSYRWPGNVRELEHVIEHAFVLCRGRVITLDHIPVEIKHYEKNEKTTSLSTSTLLKRKVSAQDIEDALIRTGGNKAKAARLLGINRITIYRKAT